ncbi:MAG TPA: serine/threonine-protein kinase, partial [Candidatus Xenobia bacterium]
MLETDAVLEGRYRIQRVIGQGGMGGVYLATYVDRPVPVAIKELLVVSRDADERAAIEHQFGVEAELLHALAHPRLPRMYDYFQSNGSWFLVMDYIAGTPLDRVVEETGPLTEVFARHVTVELADVMGYLHGQSSPIIFRDLKPANIMLRNDHHVTVIDFGIAKMATPATTRTSTLIRAAGTTGFAAPEQYGAGTDQRSDIYSLGATLYYLLTGL